MQQVKAADNVAARLLVQLRDLEVDELLELRIASRPVTPRRAPQGLKRASVIAFTSASAASAPSRGDEVKAVSVNTPFLS
jgi:hypothetical protein